MTWESFATKAMLLLPRCEHITTEHLLLFAPWATQLLCSSGSVGEANSSEAEGPWIDHVHCNLLHERKLKTLIELVPSRNEPLAQACGPLAVKPVVKGSSPARDKPHQTSLDPLGSAQSCQALHITCTSVPHADKPHPSSDPCGSALSCNVVQRHALSSQSARESSTV
jgi:hypothetical protein